MLSLLKEMPSNCWVNASQVAEELLRNWVILEEFKAHALTPLHRQALDVVEDEACKVSVSSRQFCLSLFTLELKLVDSVFKYLDGSINVVLEHESAPKQVVGLERVTSDSFAELIHLTDDLIQIGLHSTLVEL